MSKSAFPLLIILLALPSSKANAQTADFFADAIEVCSNTIVRFTDSSTGAFLWEWNFGSGAIPASAAGAGPHDVIYSTGGIKTVTLTINGNITKQATNYINVSPLTIGGSITGSPGNICTGEFTGIMMLSGHTGIVEKWQKRYNGGNWTDINNNSVTYSERLHSSGIYQFRAVVRSGQCASAVSSDVSVIVNALPRSISTITQSVCSGTGFILNLQENISNGILCTFTWTGNFPVGLTGGAPYGTGQIGRAHV